MTKKPFLSLLVSDIFSSSGYLFGVSVLLSIASGLMQSISIFLLFPLLQAANIIEGQDAGNWLTDNFTLFIEIIGAQNGLITILTLFFVLIVLRSYVVQRHSLLSSKINYDFVGEARKKLYASIMATDWAHFCRQTPTHYSQVLGADVDRIGQGVSDLNSVISFVLLFLGYGVAALLIDWRITVCVMLAGSVAAFFQQTMSQRSYQIGVGQTERSKDLFFWIGESLGNLKLIKSSDKEKHANAVVGEIIDSSRDNQIEANRHYANLTFLFQLYSAAILVLFIFLSVSWLHLSSASLLVLIFVFSRMMPLVSTIWVRINRLRNMQGAFENYQKLYIECCQNRSVQTEQNRDDLSLEESINLRGLSFNYKVGAQKDVISNLNLELPAGQITAFLGVSGSGKTTLCDLIAGLYQPIAGSICTDSTKLGPQNIKQWHSQISYLTQDVLLFNDTVKSNLLWYQPDATDEQITGALEAVELKDWFERLPEGLDTMIGDRGVRLSGGEKQRLVLARSFLSQPTLLILDEATSALDAINERKIGSILKKFCQHTTVIIIAHRLSSIKLADHIVVLEKGKVTDRGDWQSLSSKEKGLFQELIKQSAL